MRFVPEGFEPFLTWLDSQARNLFPEEYPREITGNDVQRHIQKYPLPELPAGDLQCSPPLFSSSPVENEAPILAIARAAFRADAANQLAQLCDPAYRLASYQRDVRAELERKRNDQVEMLKVLAFEHHRQHFYKGIFETIVIAADGAWRAIPSHHWASDDVLRSVTSGEFEGRPMFIKLENPSNPADIAEGSSIVRVSPAKMATLKDADKTTPAPDVESPNATSPIFKLAEFFRQHGSRPEFQGMPIERWRTEAKNAGIVFLIMDFQAAWRTAVQVGQVTPLAGAPKRAQQSKRRRKR